MDHILTDEDWEYLLTCPVFRDCSRTLVQTVLSHPDCTLNSFQSAQTLYRPNRFFRCLGVLLSGSVRVTKDALAISVLTPGDLFGAAALFNDHPDYAATLTAISPCRVLLLTQDLVSRLMDESSLIRDNYIRYLSGRICFLSGKIRSLAAEGTEGKLKQYLLTTLSGDHPRLSCPATELAQRLGISRASLYRAFEALEGQNLIRREGRTILVPDLKALESSEF